MTKRGFLSGIVLLLVLVAFGLRIYRLDSQPLRGDESFSVQFSSNSLSWLLTHIAGIDPQPPLYYFLLHYWMRALGDSEFATRFLSLIPGVLTVPLIYRLGRSLGQPKTGVLAAFLAAINPFQVWHAQDVRNYTIWPFLSVAGLVFLLDALRAGKTRYWAGYAGMTLLSLYTHYYHVFMLLFENLFVLTLLLTRQGRKPFAVASRRRLLRTWLVIQASLAVFYCSWLAYGSSVRHYQGTGDSPTLWAAFSRSLTAFSLGETVPVKLAAILTSFLLLILLIGLVHAFKEERYLSVFLALYIFVPTLCVFTVAQVRPLFRERYLNVIAPAYYLTFSYAFLALREQLRRWRMAPVALGVAFFAVSGAYSLTNHYHNPSYHKSPDWRALSDRLAAATRPGDVIVLNYPDPSFSYYYDGNVPSFVLPRSLLTEKIKTETAEALRLLSQRYQRIWFSPLKAVEWDNVGFVETWLNRHATLIEEQNILGFRWLIYRPLLVSLEDVQNPISVGFGDAIHLRGYEWQTGLDDSSEVVCLESGSALHLTLYWEAADEIETSYTVFIHLIDAPDHIWAQRDSIPQGGDFPTDEWLAGDIIVDQYAILVPSDTPSGDYLLVVGMYDSASGQRLSVTDAGGAHQGYRAIIGHVCVR